MVELIGKDEIIEIKNTDNLSLDDVIGFLDGEFIKLYDYIFSCNQIKMIRLWGADNE